MKFVKNSGVFKFFHSNLVEFVDFIKTNRNANDFSTWAVNTAVNGFLISVSLASLFNYPWTPLLLAGAGFAHYMFFDMLAQGASIIKRAH